MDLCQPHLFGERDNFRSPTVRAPLLALWGCFLWGCFQVAQCWCIFKEQPKQETSAYKMAKGNGLGLGKIKVMHL